METFEDISSPGVIISSTDYEVHTSSTVPSDLRDGIVILCYNHDIQFRYRFLWLKVRNETSGETYSCEFLRNLTLSVCCKVTPFASNLFHLYDESKRWLIPLGKLVNCLSGGHGPSVYLLRIIWKPKDLMDLHKADPAALRYLYYQCHDDFVYGDSIERVSAAQKTYESLLGLVIFDMVAFALNSEPKIELKELKRKYRANQFINCKILTDIEPSQRFRALYKIFNMFRINHICRRNLEKHYRDFSCQRLDGGTQKQDDGALNVMLSYIKAITDKVAGYFIITGQLLDKEKMVVIDHLQNQVFIQDKDGTKEELFEISKLQRHNGIGVSCDGNGECASIWKLRLYITRPDNEWKRIELDFGSYEEAYHIAAAIISLYQSVVLYLCVDLTNDELLAPPSIMKLKNSGYHGPLSDSIVLKLMHNVNDRQGAYLLWQSPCRWQIFYLEVWSHKPQQDEAHPDLPAGPASALSLMKYSICLSGKKVSITECFDLKNSETAIEMKEESFDSLFGLLTAYREILALKEIISPSSKFKAGFPVESEDKSERSLRVEGLCCSQPHIIPSNEVKILKRSDSKLGDGSHTIVTKALWKQKTIAVKMIKESEAKQLQERLLQVSASQFLGLRSAFLMEIHGFSIDGFTQYLLMECCLLGKLSGFLVKNEVKETLKVRHLLEAQRQILNGLEFLHDHSCCHGNLRCGNVLVSDFSDHRLIVKLADPGLSRILTDSTTNGCRIQNDRKFRSDLRSYADTLQEMYSIWTPNGTHIDLGRPVHCPKELFDSIMSNCWDLTCHRNLTAADVSKDLTYFEQSFSGGDLHLFTPEVKLMPCNGHLAPASNTDDVTEEPMVIERIFIKCEENKHSTLGQGHYGQVFRGMYKDKPCAIKKLHRWHSDNIEKDNELEREFEIMAELDHVSIVKLFGRCRPIRDVDRCEPFLLVMEYLEGGCLLTLLHEPGWKSRNNLEAPIFKNWAFQIAKGLEYLHSKNIVHRDLACRNILLTKDQKSIKISDFGLARLLNERDYYKCGQRDLPMYWLAPESFPLSVNAQCKKASDIWSYGVVIWELFNYGAKPQSAEPYCGLKCYQGLYDLFSSTTQRLCLPDGSPELMTKLVTNCWKFAPSDRPTASEIANLLSS